MRMATAAVAVGLFVAGASGCSSSSTSTTNTAGQGASTTSAKTGTTIATGSTLPPAVILSLDPVQKSFPEVTKVGKSGADETAIGNTVANYAVAFTDASGDKKVTISVGQYASEQDAIANYATAVQASKDAPGFKLTEAPKLGQEAFAGTSQVGDAQHYGLGARDGRLIIAATFAGIPVTPENQAKLIALTADEIALAKKTLGAAAN